ncbi:MAG: leucyl aminopeptidase family protein [Bacteroidales bacterium]
MIQKTKTIDVKAPVLCLCRNYKEMLAFGFTQAEQDFIQKEVKANSKSFFSFLRTNDQTSIPYLLQLLPKEEPSCTKFEKIENIRLLAEALLSYLNENKLTKCSVWDQWETKEQSFAYLEALMLGAYRFDIYKTKVKYVGLQSIDLLSDRLQKKDLEQLEIITQMVYQVRNWVNEPVSTLNAMQLAERAKHLAHDKGVKVQIWDKKEIREHKMGGILGVNQGSVDEPSFTIMEWKPAKACNKKPIVLVGKGVVFDSGGMNIKTGDYMNDMKSDMAGAAVVANVICALAQSKTPVHLIALLPATDNRLNGNALVPGDIIYMHDHTSVEIVNTDAEGRLLLADAISFAQEYKPELIISIATLTGAASRAIGKQGIAAMQEHADAYLPLFTQTGLDIYERLCFFPMWKEYEEALDSAVADIKNCGGGEAGMITAAKFLAHFTTYPLIHLDIAGTAFLDKRDAYRGCGATASGARLLYTYLQQYANTKGAKNA